MSNLNLSKKNSGFIYRCVFKTLPEGERGTNGAVYIVHNKFDNELGKLQVDPSLTSVDPKALVIPDVAPFSSGCLINQTRYLKLDTADAPGDSSFEQGDTDICYFYFDETFALPDTEKLPLRLVSGTAKDHWTFECTITVFDATGPIAKKSFPKRTKYVEEGKSRPKEDEVLRPFASTHIDKDKRVVRYGELPAHVLAAERQLIG
ncbi:MAG: hypothetical protein J0M26_18105 [Planctomycetes bacterium]|nr:hypothetical protein [Planctomycetota bacterium]